MKVRDVISRRIIWNWARIGWLTTIVLIHVRPIQPLIPIATSLLRRHQPRLPNDSLDLTLALKYLHRQPGRSVPGDAGRTVALVTNPTTAKYVLKMEVNGREGGTYWQCTSQIPGLSDLKAKAIHPPRGSNATSRRGGFV
jgi:hypothetical protein